MPAAAPAVRNEYPMEREEMTLATYDTDPATAGPLSRAEERRRDKLAQAEIARQDRAARLEEQRQDRAARLDEQRQARADRLEEERQAKADKLAEQADRRAARAEAIAAAGEWAAAHRDDLLLIPIVVVPALLSWAAMSSFGIALFGGIGRALPVLSEVGMWYFAFRIEDARRHPGEKLFALYAGMVFCAAICASLNLIHGLKGPIPGSITPGGLTGAAYALIAVSGIVIHQLGTAYRRHRPRPARRAPRPAARTAAAGATWRATAGAAPGATAGATTGATRQAVAPAAVRALPPAEGHETGATNPGTAQPETEKDAEIIEFNPEELSRPGGTQRAMRQHWEMMIAAGKIPTGADLNRAVGKDPKYSLGKKYAGEWRAEISDDTRDGGDGAAPDGQDAEGGSRAQVARTRTRTAAEPGEGLAAGEGQ